MRDLMPLKGPVMIKQSSSRRVVPLPDSHQALLAGVDKMVNLVRPTFGPNTRTVVIETLRGTVAEPIEILDDGGTIARRVYKLEDRNENMGAMVLRNLLWRLEEQVGDGTATAAVIFQAILHSSHRWIAAGGNAMALRGQIEQAAVKACDLLRTQVKPLSGEKEISNCALSICHDKEMAKLLGEVFYITGGEGFVRAVESSRRDIGREYFEGCYWTGTLISPHMITETGRQEAILEDPAVFVSDLKISAVDDIVPLMEAALSTGRKNLFMVVEELTHPALSVLLANLKSGVLKSAAVRSTALYSEAGYLYEDLGTLTGARPFIRALGDNPRRITASDFGLARRAWATQNDFGIVAGCGDPLILRQHTALLRKRLRAATKPEEIHLLRKRLGKLLGGVATLNIGGATDVEMKTRLAVAKKTIDALHHAVEDGVVPGGGSSLVHIAQMLRKNAGLTDSHLGIRIVADALDEPLRVIAQNSGFEALSILSMVREAPTGYGFDINAGAVVNLWETGLVDSIAVLEAAILNAAHTAALLMTTDVLVHSGIADGYRYRKINKR
jgi:chaperonin GroEL